jgi:hypothetical protein
LTIGGVENGGLSSMIEVFVGGLISLIVKGWLNKIRRYWKE